MIQIQFITGEKKMKKIKRRKKPEDQKPPHKKLKRRKVVVERLSSSGKCKGCENLFLYCFEGEKKEQIENNPKMAKRFKKLLDSELCLTCLTQERNTIKAYDIMQFYVLKGDAENIHFKKDKSNVVV